MNFAIDYDGCADSNITMFKTIISILRNNGNRVYIVTMRYPSECADVVWNFGQIVDGVIPTSRKAKETVTLKHGIKIDVWMDDNPIAVYKDAVHIWGTSSPEGQIVSVDHDKKVTNTENVSSGPLCLFDTTKLIY